MNGFRITLGLLALVLIVIAFISFNTSDTTAPQVTPVATENPYEFEILPPRVQNPDAEPPLPIIPADNGAYEQIKPSFVKVESSSYSGSGVIVRAGLIVTNAHVVLSHNGRPHANLRVELLNGRSTQARVVAYSTTYDLAVLAVDSNFGTPATLATERVYVGQRLLAVGNPSRGTTMKYGTVLALELPIHHDFIVGRTADNVNMLVTTNRVVEGYSGGPMVDGTTGIVYGITVGQVRYYNDPETGERIRIEPYAGAAMHINEVMAEVDRLLAAT